MSLFISFLLVAVPGLPIFAGIWARFSSPDTAGRLTGRAAFGSAILAVLAVVTLLLQGSQVVRWAPWGADAAMAATLRLDAVSVTMILLISFLGAIVLRFSQRYLAGDSQQARFFSWMSFTLGAVLLVVLSSHLLLLWAAWIATSLCLHRLLLHYPDRAGAVFAARKKFVVSRLGDACLLAAAWVLHAHYHTFDLDQIFAAVAAGNTAGLGIVGLLLALCAMLKSAQFPFHSWLPDTMETPTPVSAFMHAGIINAGGFLIVRLSPILAAAPLASQVLAIAGAVTAAFGAMVMLAQPSVKRALAYSTIAQMGFMILQCGLGAYGLALLHIVAHSLYKAHAFLTAGSTIGAVPRVALPLHFPALTVGVLSGGLLVTFGATVLQWIAPGVIAYSGVFTVILMFAIAYLIARTWSAGGGVRVMVQGLAVAIAVTVLSFALHAVSSVLFGHLSANPPPRALLIGVGAVFTGLFLFQSLLWRTNRYPSGQRLYVHVLNGFYLGTFFNRLLNQLWPRHAVN